MAKRRDLTPTESLVSNPFAALASIRDELPPGRDELPPGEVPNDSETPTASAVAGPARAVVRYQRKGRGGKEATIVEQLGLTPEVLDEWCRELKRALGCGGGVEGEALVFGGDQRARLPAMLEAKGVRRVTLLVMFGLFACGPTSIEADGETGSSGAEATGTSGADEQAEIDQALADLAAIVEGNLEWFSEPHPGEDPDHAPHRCPHPVSSTSGEAGVTPDFAVSCHEGDGGHCVPWTGDAQMPKEPGYYDDALWIDNNVWADVGFAKADPHAFHYNLIVVNHPGDYGACTFTAQAFADLDGDFVFSTYERRGHVDEDGQQLEPLFVNLAWE